MKLTIILLSICTLSLFTASCDYIKNHDRPHLELTGESPYRLDISNFTWSYGLTSINELNGDFEKLDEKVYNALNGKSGLCSIFIQSQQKDQYGKLIGTVENFGQIDINELNRYEDWHYWHNNAGIRPMILKRIQSKVNEPIAQVKPPTIDTIDYSVVPAPKKLVYENYLFSMEDLHPSEDDRADIDSNTYVVEGTITRVSFDKGLIEIKGNKGQVCIADFSPYEVAVDVREKLELAIRPGNAIKSLCDFKDGGRVELVAAKVTDAVARSM